MNNELNLNLVYTFIFVSCGIGFVYGIFNWITITRIELGEKLPESDDNRTTITKTHLETMQKIYIDIKNVKNINSREPKIFYGLNIFTFQFTCFCFL